MASRVGLGPVFAFEWLMTARRWQVYALRSLTVLLLLGAMWLVWVESPAGYATGEVSIARQAQVGRSFFGTTAMILLGLVGLAAPAATAGSICLDRARGNLTLLFATDLSDPEIVLGKLAARLVPVLGLILCATPVLAVSTLFGGIDPVGLFGTILVMIACAVFGCSLALTLSVWGRKTHEVLMATYLFGILYLLAAPIIIGIRSMLPATWWGPGMPSVMELARFNPVFLVIATFEPPPPGMMPQVTLWTQATFLGLGLAASAALLGLATWRIRSVVVRQLGRAEGSRRREGAPLLAAIRSIGLERLGARGKRLARLHRLYRRINPVPSLDRNPVLWRECQRATPSRWDRVMWGVYVLFCGGFSLYAIVEMIEGNRWGREIGMLINALQVAVGLLMLSVSAATSLAEERQRGSLDVLMATPLSTRSIVWGKWRGAFRGVPPLLILPTALSTSLASYTGHFWAVALIVALIVAYGAAITSLGLALATWIPQMGRAVGLTVALYTFMCIGWIPISLIFFEDGPDDGVGVAAGSPLMGVGAYSALIAGDGPQSQFDDQTIWMIFWIVAYGGVAVALLLATLGTFNRCLGRIDDPSIVDEEDLDLEVAPRKPAVAEVMKPAGDALGPEL